MRKEAIELDKEVRNAGIILIVLGILHFVFSGFLYSTAGLVLIPIGIIAFFYRSKRMLLVFGILLILIGILNLSSVIYEVSSFWLVFGTLQIYWGIMEIIKFRKVKENPKYEIKEKNKGFVWYSLRTSFWIMIGFWAISSIAWALELELSYTFSFLWIFFVIFTFVVSIIHLKKHKSRAFAIVSLVLASYLILTMVIGFIYLFYISASLDEISDELDEILAPYEVYSEQEERIKDYLTEDGYEVLFNYILNYSANAPFFEWYDIEDNTICDETSDKICYSDKVGVHIEMKSLGNRNEQVWDVLNTMWFVYPNAFTYQIDIKSPTDTCTYLIFGVVLEDYYTDYNLETRELIDDYIDNVVCS